MELIGDTTPPGGWTYTQPEIGYKIVSINLPAFKAAIFEHRRANGYDTGKGWWEVLQTELCLDPTNNYPCRDSVAVPERAMEINDLLRFFRTMREWGLKRGFDRVAPEIAQERARVCEQCPHNTTVSGCSGCQGIVRWLGEYLTDEEKDLGAGTLNNCGICKCVLRLKVQLPADVIAAADKDGLEYPAHCWVGNE
jgi:hypothetical protein